MSDTVFKNKIEMRNFAYEGETRMDEETVKHALGTFLQSQGYTVAIGKKRERGADIRATKEGLKLIVEAKGEGSTSVMLHTHFVYVLGEILQRMREAAAEYGIALPAHRKYVRLTEELSDNVRFVLHLNFYFVRPIGSEHEVALLRWQDLK